MAKKTNKRAAKITLEESLPRNIHMVGERGEEDKNIYIFQPVYKEIHQFTQNKTTNESGGMLIGTVIKEFGKTNIVIQGFVEAKYCEATPTTLKFTHDTWNYIHKEIYKKYENGQIVGWIHTHPDFGIFLSEYDKFIQENFFKEEHQIAYVVDPIQNIEGFYFWNNGKIERCKGFYIFENTDQKIEIEEEKEQKAENGVDIEWFKQLLTYVIGGVFITVVVASVILNMNLFNRMKILEAQCENLSQGVNLKILYLQQQISVLQDEMENLKEEISDVIENTENRYSEEAGVNE